MVIEVKIIYFKNNYEVYYISFQNLSLCFSFYVVDRPIIRIVKYYYTNPITTKLEDLKLQLNNEPSTNINSNTSKYIFKKCY